MAERGGSGQYRGTVPPPNPDAAPSTVDLIILSDSDESCDGVTPAHSLTARTEGCSSGQVSSADPRNGRDKRSEDEKRYGNDELSADEKCAGSDELSADEKCSESVKSLTEEKRSGSDEVPDASSADSGDATGEIACKGDIICENTAIGPGGDGNKDGGDVVHTEDSEDKDIETGDACDSLVTDDIEISGTKSAGDSINGVNNNASVSKSAEVEGTKSVSESGTAEITNSVSVSRNTGKSASEGASDCGTVIGENADTSDCGSAMSTDECATTGVISDDPAPAITPASTSGGDGGKVNSELTKEADCESSGTSVVGGENSVGSRSVAGGGTGRRSSLPLRLSCINSRCTSSRSSCMLPACSDDLAYFSMLYGPTGVPVSIRSHGKRLRICTSCRVLVDQYTQTVLETVKNGKPLLQCAVDQLDEEVRVDCDSDDADEQTHSVSDGGHSSGSDESVFSFGGEVDDEISQAMKEVKFDSQLEGCVEWLRHKVSHIEDCFRRTEKDLSQLDSDVLEIYRELYRNRPPSRSVSPLELVQCGENLYVSPNTRTTPKHQLPRHSRAARPKTTARAADRGKQVGSGRTSRKSDGEGAANNWHEETSTSGVADIMISDVVQADREVTEPPDLPPVGVIERKQPTNFQVVFALSGSVWHRTRVVDVLTDKNATKFVVAKNRIVLEGHQVAYGVVPNVRLSVGERVISHMMVTQNLTTPFHSGTIGEAPKAMNNFRYLVFFDNGSCRYVRHKDLRLIHAPSSNILLDVPEATRDFIATYLSDYPERAMVRLQAGQQVKMKYHDRWVAARVCQVDAALAKLTIPENSEPMWVYRGSSCLAPIFNQLSSRKQPRKLGTGARRHTLNNTGVGKKNRVYVEYNREDSSYPPAALSQTAEDVKPIPLSPSGSVKSSSTTTAPSRAVARKSTASSSHTGVLPPPSQLPLSSSAEGEGYIVEIPSKPVVIPRRIRPHTCSVQCVRQKNRSVDELKGQNPLLMPMTCGWIREIVRFRASRRTVVYRAPCGRRLRNIAEVHTYLSLTQCNLEVDCFCFDYWVHCFTEFEPSKKYCYIKDMSYGKENVPVSCVNSIDRDYPEFVEYSTKRIPTTGVALNLDTDFLICCDCTDDCQDKTRCACWQETIQNSAFGLSGEVDPNTGYQYRRLVNGNVITAIYECNSRCKCKRSCLNRVVQHPTRLRLQVFKTLRRGWGIRCLDDIPKGGFICVYVGQLLNEATANEDGKTYGDEYLAELDFIEVLEHLKEGYESDVVEDEDDDASSGQDQARSPEEVAEASDEDSSQPDHTDADFVPSQVDKDVSNNLRRSSRPRLSRGAAASSGDDSDSVRQKSQKRSAPSDSESSNKRKPSDSNKPDASKPAKKTTTKVPSSILERLPDSQYRSVREHFGSNEYCYIVDAKNIGNIGRYLNHSCSPNVFVQNVFVDTQDLRLPWVAFFALSYIRAGTELTWNYNYEVGSVPGKVMYCQCGSDECRGRLL